MDQFKQLETFVLVATRGSLKAAADTFAVSPAIIGRRLDALEMRLGVKLLVRTTRRVSLTHEGAGFLEHCQRLLADLAAAEASVAAGAVRATGLLRLSAPAGFGRRHVAPQVGEFLAEHPDVTANLDLSDRIVDLVNEDIDCAVRLGNLLDSNLISVRLGEMPRVVVASPAYIESHGAPLSPAELDLHNCLALRGQRGWTLRAHTGQTASPIKVNGRFECNDGAVLHDWVLEGRGLAWRSWWEVGADLRAGRLLTVLDDYAAPPVGIYAVFVQREQLPVRVRLFIDRLKQSFGDPAYWDRI